MTAAFDPHNAVRFCTRDDLERSGMITRKLLGKWVAAFWNEGEPYAMEMSCKHQGANLAEGKIEGHWIVCPRHFWKYDLRTGACQTPHSPSLRRHDLYLQGEDVYVSLRPTAQPPSAPW